MISLSGWKGLVCSVRVPFRRDPDAFNRHQDDRRLACARRYVSHDEWQGRAFRILSAARAIRDDGRHDLVFSRLRWSSLDR
jgi:hypothetical protein